MFDIKCWDPRIQSHHRHLLALYIIHHTVNNSVSSVFHSHLAASTHFCAPVRRCCVLCVCLCMCMRHGLMCNTKQHPIANNNRMTLRALFYNWVWKRFSLFLSPTNSLRHSVVHLFVVHWQICFSSTCLSFIWMSRKGKKNHLMCGALRNLCWTITSARVSPNAQCVALVEFSLDYLFSYLIRQITVLSTEFWMNVWLHSELSRTSTTTSKEPNV